MKKKISLITITSLIFLGVNLLLFFNPAVSGADDPNPIKLTIKETSGIDRVKEPVSSGVPLPKDTVFNVNQLRVLDGNKQEVPAQFKVLSRWGQLSDTAKAIKWVLVSFQADVPVNCNAIYYLEYGANFIKDYGPNLLIDNKDSISFNTGRLNFSINKNSFRLFDNVFVDGKKIVDTSEQNGIFVIENGTNKIYNSLLGAPSEIDVEENGPLKAVLQVQGPLMASGGEYLGKPLGNVEWSQPYPYVHYNIRITVYKDKGYAKVSFIFENDGASGVGPEDRRNLDPQNIFIEDLRLKTFLNFSNPSIYTVNSQYTGNKAVLAARGQFPLTADIDDTFPYTFNVGGSVVETGTKYPGWIEVSKDDKNIALGMKYFWQKHPLDITYNNGFLEFAVMPEGEGYPLGINNYYAFDGGRHYGVELLYRFSTGARNAQETKQSMTFLQDPLFVFAEPDYYASTGVWKKLAPAYVQTSDPVLQEAINRYEKQVLAQGDIAYAEPTNRRPASTVSSYRGDSAQWYGSLNFGDIMWAKNYASLHWDWTQGILLHMLRHSNTALWKQAQEFIPHKRDVDQYWGDRTDSQGADFYINHLSRYESDSHNRLDMNYYGGDTANPAPAPSHNWNGGLVLSYLLTGDEESLEAAKESYLYAYGYYKDRLVKPTFDVYGCEIRNEGWTMVALLNLYRATGDQKYIDLALAIGKNDLLYGEQLSGGHGVWGGPDAVPCAACPDTTQILTFMHAIVSENLTDLYEETRDKEIGQLIVRMADYGMAKIIYGGEYNAQGLYKPLQIDYYYKGTATRNNTGDTPYDYYYTDLMAAAYQVTGNVKYLNFARNLFKDVSFYYYGGAGQEYINPARRDPAVYADDMYNSTWNKVKGWLLNAHQIYLNVENQAAVVYAQEDINSDGKVNVIDVQLCVNVILGIVEDSEKKADVNGDKIVNVSDVQKIVNLILGL